MERVALILVAYNNSGGEVARALDAWSSQCVPPAGAYVVANSPLPFTEVRERATVLDPGENIGFTRGVNVAARQASGDGYTHILIANIDVELISSEILAKLATAMAATPGAAFVSPGIALWPDTGAVWYRGAHVDRPAWIARQPGIGRRWPTDSSGVVETGYFSGCCALVNLDVFQALGGFDESLFMYYDEAELALRARAIGWHSYFVDEPLVAHAKPGRAFTKTEAYYHARNSTLLLHRHEKGISGLLGRAVQWVVTPAQLLRCDSQNARSAYLAGMLGRSAP